jgi:hypothetical protein
MVTYERNCADEVRTYARRFEEHDQRTRAQARHHEDKAMFCHKELLEGNQKLRSEEIQVAMVRRRLQEQEHSARDSLLMAQRTSTELAQSVMQQQAANQRAVQVLQDTEQREYQIRCFYHGSTQHEVGARERLFSEVMEDRARVEMEYQHAMTRLSNEEYRARFLTQGVSTHANEVRDLHQTIHSLKGEHAIMARHIVVTEQECSELHAEVKSQLRQREENQVGLEQAKATNKFLLDSGTEYQSELYDAQVELAEIRSQAADASEKAEQQRANDPGSQTSRRERDARAAPRDSCRTPPRRENGARAESREACRTPPKRERDAYAIAPFSPPERADDDGYVKVKEAEKVVVPAYPNAVTLHIWKTHMVRAVRRASGNPRYQKVQDWISEAWQNATREELSDPGGYNMVMLDLKIADLELEDPGYVEVQVKVEAAGLCHSDLSVINGDRPRPMPMAIGHEASGTIEKVGPGVDTL